MSGDVAHLGEFRVGTIQEAASRAVEIFRLAHESFRIQSLTFEFNGTTLTVDRETKVWHVVRKYWMQRE